MAIHAALLVVTGGRAGRRLPAGCFTARHCFRSMPVTHPAGREVCHTWRITSHQTGNRCSMHPMQTASVIPDAIQYAIPYALPHPSRPSTRAPPACPLHWRPPCSSPHIRGYAVYNVCRGQKPERACGVCCSYCNPFCDVPHQFPRVFPCEEGYSEQLSHFISHPARPRGCMRSVCKARNVYDT